ncbi:MAG: PSD1 and planctomycete cytochrome C domain-containing protein [Verrucomicrobiota bacterium]
MFFPTAGLSPRARHPAALWLVLFFAAAAGAASAVVPAEEAEWFETRVRPLLAEHCLECHDGKKQKGGLRLDSRAGWEKGGGTGPAIVPHNAAASLLLKAVRREDPDLQMPPKKALEPGAVAILEEWISRGAPDPREDPAAAAVRKTGMTLEEGRGHWAFQPVRDSVPPADGNDGWSRQPLDRFIHAGLTAAGLKPNPPADRRSLIRRAGYTLTGLPPSFEEVEAFAGDTAPEAFEKVVDRLLASPRYGEHQARHWLDVARYSDTKGYVYGREEKRQVQAAPYRDWVVRSFNEDMPYDRFLLRQLAADQLEPAGSPHLAAMGFLTLGRRFLGVTHDIIDDRIDVTMRGAQALTVACARCHDHKFDPVSARDYYSLYGIFRSSAEAVVRCGRTAAGDLAFEKELTVRQAKLREEMTRRRDEQAARVRARVADYLLAQLEPGKYPEESFSQIIAAGDLNPLFVRRWQTRLAADKADPRPLFASWTELAGTKDADPARLREKALEYGALFDGVEREWRQYLSGNPGATALPDPRRERLRAVLHGPDSPCLVPDEHIANIEFFFPTDVIVDLWKWQGEVDRWFLQSPEAGTATILTERAEPYASRVFKRGNPLLKGAEAPRQFLQVLTAGDSKPFTKGGGRLELAQAIASRENPLTARVMVNRVWMHDFGNGLVSTPSDFGTRAEPPSHPELLDWLAARFMEDGWSLKKLHRRLLLSAAWQQSSAPPPEPDLTAALLKDPGNRLLWRMNPQRLSFEEMRDSWLAAAGLLDPRMGGAPVELFDPGNTRRTLYGLVDRENLTAALRTFDFANPDLSIPQRTETTVPQQALFLLNHPFAAGVAKALAGGPAGSEKEEDRVRGLYIKLLQRAPRPAEAAAALDFVQAGEIPAAPAHPPSADWRYGYGEWDEGTGRLRNFTPLPHSTGMAWQGGGQWPDAALGWVRLTAGGGHPGNDRSHAAVRRWTAPRDGIYRLTSSLTHEPEAGDGIRAFVGHSTEGLLGSATLRHGTAELNAEKMVLKAGDTVDFVTDINGTLESDQFLWRIRIQLPDSPAEPPLEWSSDADFSAAALKMKPLSPWEQLAQTLMLTNEFLFID